jgi:hypothetical protein
MPQCFAKQIVVAVLVFIGLGGGQAWADRYQRVDQRDGDLPASVRRIQRETGGQVLKAQPIQRDGREVYRVKVLTPQGRIRVVEEEMPLPRNTFPQRDDRERGEPQRDPRQRNEPPVPNPPRNHRPD